MENWVTQFLTIEIIHCISKWMEEEEKETVYRGLRETGKELKKRRS